MPALKPCHVFAEAEDGTTFDASVTVTLLEDHTFSVEVPEALLSTVGEIASPNAHVGYARSGAKPRVYAGKLADALHLLKRAAENYLSGQTTEELVICYNYWVDVSFWQNADGSIAPNGCGQDSGQWWASKTKGHQYHANNRLTKMGFAVAAKVFRKITTTRAQGQTVRYVELETPLHERNTEPRFLLNDWTILDVDPNQATEMPYSDKAALWFHELQTNICRMARAVDVFFADKERLALAIESGNTKLLNA